MDSAKALNAHGEIAVSNRRKLNRRQLELASVQGRRQLDGGFLTIDELS